MTRFQKLVATTLAATLALVIVGVIVRASGSGLGCPDWPLCYGQLLPPAGDGKAWAEWIHRFIAAAIGFLVLGVAVLALLRERERPTVVVASVGAILLVVFQAWLGRETVRLGNSGESVTAHLAAAMAVVGLLAFILVRAGCPARPGGSGGSPRFALLAAFCAAAVFVLLLFGSNVTALDAALIFPDWPLMGGNVVPPFGQMAGVTGSMAFTHALHRYAGVVVGLVLLGTWIAAVRTQRSNRPLVGLITIAAVLYPIQALVGAAQIWTQLEPWTQTVHVALATFVWTAAVAASLVAWYSGRAVEAPVGDGGPAGEPPAGREPPAAPARSTRDTVRAYIALTKPRIIELLLITTVPAMVLATRDLPGVDWGNWAVLVFWTLVGGTLAAGAANAMNQYLDRDIDLLMTRTRRRPLPAHAVEPARAVAFGIVLAVVSIALLAWFVNLLAAVLTLLAIAFYVVVYTVLLKRTSTQNIVIGGAAGALPPVIGWAAVTGDVGVPALFLFALVFYWTPPHFWALALRITRDYAAAGIPMLPVVRGTAETTRQIFLYTILLVVLSLMFVIVAGMGLIYAVTAVATGAVFLWQAGRLARTATVEGTTAGAIRLYRYSISYLTLLFAAVAIDALWLIRIS